jgi:uncharacterized protein YndB with AHSA1/START domain
VTDIRVIVELAHPPPLVWRALTDHRLLCQWFMPTDFVARKHTPFRFHPTGLAGFQGPIDVEISHLTPPSRLTMQWRGEQLHSQVIWELEPTDAGCRLIVEHTGFLGLRGHQRRRELIATYGLLFGERLPATVDQLADAGGTIPRQRSGSTDVVAGGWRVLPVAAEATVPAPPTEPGNGASGDAETAPIEPVAVSDGWAVTQRLPRPPPVAGAWGRAGTGSGSSSATASDPGDGTAPAADRAARTRRRLIVGGVVGVVLALGGGAVAATMNASGPTVAGPDPRPDRPDASAQPGPSGGVTDSTGPGRSSAVPRGPNGGPAPVTPTAAPGNTVAPSQPTEATPLPPGAPRLTAGMTVERTGLLGLAGYRATVTITNPETNPSTGWTLGVVLAEGQKLDEVTGAAYAQSGTTVTFTPTGDNGAVPPGGEVRVSFEVSGILATPPSGCTVDGQPCS